MTSFDTRFTLRNWYPVFEVILWKVPIE